MGIETERREFAGLVRQSRRSQKLTQAVLCERVGITTGALSRYESGDVRVVGDATLRGLCEALKLVGPAWLVGEVAGAESVAERVADVLARYYCPTPFCRLNAVFMTPGRVHFIPQMVESTAGAVVFCRWCGADMHSQCLECGAALAEGSGFCIACGAEYVPSARVDEDVLRALQFSPPPVATTLSRPAAGLPFWQPQLPGAGSGAVSGEAGAGRQVKRGGPSHGGTA
jgi:transcriptional regulator with XRE-family HTH domain